MLGGGGKLGLFSKTGGAVTPACDKKVKSQTCIGDGINDGRSWEAL